MRYTVAVMLVALLLLAALPATAQAPESGLMVLTDFSGTVVGTGHAYPVFATDDVLVFGTLLAPERGQNLGVGIDAGSVKTIGRFGIGIVEDRWGLYLRAGVGW